MRDEAIVRRVCDGEGEAFRELVDRYAPLVFAIARRYSDDADEVEDLAQDVFVSAYSGLGGFRGEASFSSWLYRIAVNRCRDQIKSAWGGRRSLDEADLNSALEVRASSGRPVTPEEELERRERASRLRWALGELVPEYAVPLLLKYEQDLSYEEIARRLGSTVGALKVRVHRAKNALRELLEDRI
jgi:RNA polymerase sigma-70 factor (ECF subfamily)